MAFNGPSANVLSGQRGPRAQRHFNGCNDERVKSEHGDPVSFIGKTREGGQGNGKGVRRQVWREGHWGERQMALSDRYESRGVMERNRKSRE